jgi:hypothetical protein
MPTSVRWPPAWRYRRDWRRHSRLSRVERTRSVGSASACCKKQRTRVPVWISLKSDKNTHGAEPRPRTKIPPPTSSGTQHTTSYPPEFPVRPASLVHKADRIKTQEVLGLVSIRYPRWESILGSFPWPQNEVTCAVCWQRLSRYLSPSSQISRFRASPLTIHLKARKTSCSITQGTRYHESSSYSASNTAQCAYFYSPQLTPIILSSSSQTEMSVPPAYLSSLSISPRRAHVQPLTVDTLCRVGIPPSTNATRCILGSSIREGFLRP